VRRWRRLRRGRPRLRGCDRRRGWAAEGAAIPLGQAAAFSDPMDYDGARPTIFFAAASAFRSEDVRKRKRSGQTWTAAGDPCFGASPAELDPMIQQIVHASRSRGIGFGQGAHPRGEAAEPRGSPSDQVRGAPPGRTPSHPFQVSSTAAGSLPPFTRPSLSKLSPRIRKGS
jgi:hypothetical protein